MVHFKAQHQNQSPLLSDGCLKKKKFTHSKPSIVSIVSNQQSIISKTGLIIKVTF
jgi:hypothetical protein